MLNGYWKCRFKKFSLEISALSHNMVFLLAPSRSFQLFLGHSLYLSVPKSSSQPVCLFGMTVWQPLLFKLQLAYFTPRLNYHQRKASLKKGLHLIHHGIYLEAPTTSPHKRVFHNNRLQIDVCFTHKLTRYCYQEAGECAGLQQRLISRFCPLQTGWPQASASSSVK